jgi:YD repeat-containing protein
MGNITSGPLGTYSYGTSRPHAAAAAGSNTYSYDANGAVLGRTESGTSYTHTYDLEGRQSSVIVGGVTTTFVSNGDGQLVAKQVAGTTVAHYVAGGRYERDPSTGATRTSYTFGGRTVAVRDRATGLHYLHQDHLGSTTPQPSATGAWGCRRPAVPLDPARWGSTDPQL